MIVTGGVNVYPLEIENVLAVHPSICDVAVVGVPDPVYGEHIKTVVQLKADYIGRVSVADLQAFCASQLSKLKCPRSIDFTMTLPRNESGKLLRRVLKEQYRTTPLSRQTHKQ
nr:hypothetical protein [Burkholderia sp. BCC1972]